MRSTALLLGATGLVGGHLLPLLADGWTHVVTLGRRAMPLAGPTHTHHIVDFDRLGEHADLFTCDALFCCLGTTMKEAGSKEAFRRVDLDIPVEAARRAADGGTTLVSLVSALGADPASRVFYNRTKGEAERAVQAAGIATTQIFRPSLLTGERDETRLGESVGELILGAASPLLIGPLRPFRPTPARDVARAMAVAAETPRPGVRVVEPVEIRTLAAR